MQSEAQTLVQVRGLKKHFIVGKGLFRRGNLVQAVNGLDFDIHQGETLGLVGESGCGKSTAGRTILQLYKPTAGTIHYQGVDITALKHDALLEYRRKIQIIFQDPYSSLNPRLTVGNIISEPLLIHHPEMSKQDRLDYSKELLMQVNMNPGFINRYPHEFSGGQRQRIGIARALAVKPEFIVCDEPISALDVSVQAQVVTLMEELQKKMNLTYLFIAHDLSMVRHISNRVAVMYLGKIVELSDRDEIYEHPQHPYTQALLRAIPVPDPVYAEAHPLQSLEGEVPSPINPPKGCYFHPRCPMATQICREEAPIFEEKTAKHFCACHMV